MSNKKIIILLILVSIILIFSSYKVTSIPAGASVTSNSTDTGGSQTPSNRSDDGGAITTLVLNALQQDYAWKAYVGNVTGKYTLDDSNEKTIYDWSFAITLGEIYISRNGSISWSNVTCANRTVISAEELALNMGADDSINKTFNLTTHKNFWVGINNIINSTCRTAYTFVNDTRNNTISESVPFQEVLLQSGTTFIYATIMETDHLGYDGKSTFDFQAIVADDSTGTVITPYFFYAELG